MAGFTVGTVVEWTSQAGGRTRTKRGEIIEVIPGNSLPAYSPLARKIAQTVTGRTHESYLVRVKGRGLYWPRVSGLRVVEAQPMQTQPQK